MDGYRGSAMRKGEHSQMLEELSDLDARILSEWEIDFIESLTDQLAGGRETRKRELTDRQAAKLAEIYERKVLGY